MTIEIEDNSVVVIEGVRITAFVLKETFRDPPDGLYSVKRVGDTIVVTKYNTAEEAAKFFA